MTIRLRERIWPMRAAGYRAALLGLVAALAGCSRGPQMSPHESAKEAARTRWNNVRSSIKVRLAEAEFRAGRLEEAERELAAAREADPDSPEASLLLARIRLEQGRTAEARQVIRVAELRWPEHGEVMYVAGMVAERSGALEEAVQKYAAASRAAPREADYLAAWGEALVATGELAEALAVIEPRLPDFADDVRLRCLAAEIYRMLGMHDAVAQRLDEAARSVTDDRTLQLELGLALAEAGRDEEAIGLLQPMSNPVAGADSAASPLARMVMARCFHRLQRLDEAENLLRGMLRENADDSHAWLLLARVALDARKWDVAREASDEAVRRAAGQPAVHQVAAYVRLCVGDAIGALAAARRAVALDDRDPTGHCLVGRCHEWLGDWQAAAEAYSNALLRAPDCEAARQMLERLGQARFPEPAESERPDLRSAALLSLPRRFPLTEAPPP